MAASTWFLLLRPPSVPSEAEGQAWLSEDLSPAGHYWLGLRIWRT